jgi:hypothetical protein
VRSFADPVDPKPIQADKEAIDSDLSPDKVGVKLIVVDHPAVTSFGHDVKIAGSEFKQSGNAPALSRQIATRKTHLNPQNDKTFET